MRLKLPTKSYNSYIKGKPSVLLDNPCFVKSLAVAYNVEESHSRTFCKSYLDFSPKRGTDTGLVLKVFNHREPFYVKLLSYWFPNHRCTMVFQRYEGDKENKTTVKEFVSDTNFSRGTYILVVTGHAFVYKDGIAIGNHDDGTRLNRKLICAIEIKQIQ